MRQASRKSAKADAHDFVAHLATGVVRAGLAATFRKRPKYFVVTLVVPDHRPLSDYSGAADTVLEEYSARTGYDEYRQKTLVLDRAKKTIWILTGWLLSAGRPTSTPLWSLGAIESCRCRMCGFQMSGKQSERYCRKTLTTATPLLWPKPTGAISILLLGPAGPWRRR